MPSDKDSKAKARASSKKRASKPGAVSVGAQEASRLDERIAQKQRKTPTASVSTSSGSSSSGSPSSPRPGAVASSGRPSDAAKVSGGGGRSGVKVVRRSNKGASPPPPPPKSLTSFDADVRAKQQGKPVAGSKPGAYAGAGGSPRPRKPSTASAAGRGELAQMERDVAAKGAARRVVVSSPGATRAGKGSAAEDAVQNKIRRSASGASGVQPVQASNSGGRAQLSSMEGAVVRKASNGAAASGPGAVAMRSTSSGDVSRGNLSALEDAVSNKVRAAGGAPSPPSPRRVTSANGRAQLSQVEADVVAKRSMTTTRSSSPVVVVKKSNRSATPTTVQPAPTPVESNEKNGGGDGRPDLEPSGGSKKNVGGGTVVDVEPKKPFTSDDVDKSNIAQEQAPPKNGVGGEPDGGMEFGTNEVDENGLAIAVAIEEEEENAFIPSAVEYDPDAKPPLHQNRRFRLYAFLSFFALLAAASGAIVGIVLTRDTETADGVAYREKLGIRERIEKLVGQEELENSDSPYARAVEWIIHTDPMEVEPDDANFLQRYTMAYFYYATSVDGPWRSCNPPEGNEQAFCYLGELMAVFPEFYEEVPATRWLSSEHECEWAGVVCDEKMQVRALEMNGQKMSGPFPGGLVHLPFLQSISFAWGGLSGPLPADVVGMKHLVNIEMQYNEFTGPIPVEWWQSRNLVRINLANNELSGSIPPEIKDLKDIKGLFLQSNKFSGQIPTEIGELKSLTYLRLARNSLEGPIPTEMGQLQRLEEMWLHRNILTGGLPTELGTMKLMQDFRVHMNEQLGGDIPDEIYNLTDMMRFDLFECNFSGTISPLIGNFPRMYSLRVYGNPLLSGELPSVIAKLPMVAIEIQGTNITGPLPDGLCELRGVEGGLMDMITDCAADPTTGAVKYQCECCSECCDAEGTCTPTEKSINEWES